MDNFNTIDSSSAKQRDEASRDLALTSGQGTSSDLHQTDIELADCCQSTIRKHVRFNPMMVCDGCRRLIKSFSDDDSFRNYIKFCKSRGRIVETHSHSDQHIVIFRGYEPYK